jgi:hypothetical protein
MTYPTDCEAEVAGVSIAYEGECKEAECEDSDGGLMIDIAGTAIKGGESQTDYCLDGAQLVEYTCLDNQLQITTVSCGKDKECEDGRCVPVPPAANNTTNVSPGCSGPVQTDPNVRQSATMNGTVYYDTCVEFKVVKEYYCKDNQLQFISHECPSGFGCEDGQCNQLGFNCSETDDGNDTAVRGRTTVTKGAFATPFDKLDQCLDEGILEEHYCLENGTAATEEILCASGTKCSSGKCISSDCSETDNGIDIYKGGITTNDDTGEDESDDCINDDSLKEVYCYGDSIRTKTVHCPEDYFCDNDRCVEGEIIN